MAGNHRSGGESGRGKARGPGTGGESAETGTDTAAARRRSRDANAPLSSSGIPRVTRLVPQVRADEYAANIYPRNTSAPRLDTDAGTTAPRQSSGVLKTASAAPPAPHAPIKPRKSTHPTNGDAPAGTSTSRMRKTLPPETITLPALSDDVDNPDGLGAYVRGRRTSTARPVRPEDTALVARQTLILNALELVGEDARVVTSQVPAIREPSDIIVDADPSPRAPVTVVPAGKLAPTPVWLQPKRPKQRSTMAGIVTCLITLGIILGVLQAVSPLSAQGAPLSPFGLLAAQNSSNSATGDPSGPWDTRASAILGLGGGAGPGVTAPGSAGLPVTKNNTTNPPKTSNPPTTNTGISPAPLRPWPPSWAYVAVPGYHSFGVSRPSNGYYWWAFGQCTWWAQYKRQDENLRHMGDARYWAGSAASRGYRVGRTPVRGATVVFQPGVEGAGGAGHVAHVERVYPGGWFLISEMNFYWNGGGWGRVDYRFAYARSGVSFIY